MPMSWYRGHSCLSGLSGCIPWDSDGSKAVGMGTFPGETFLDSHSGLAPTPFLIERWTMKPGMSEGLGPHRQLGQTSLSPLSPVLRRSWG